MFSQALIGVGGWMLDKLIKLNLRDIWKDEAQDFTPWLASEDNLNLLGETLRMELELKAREQNVGPFSADILCTNKDDGSLVLIENQLDKTDHKHLGQLMTYAAGLDTVSIIWISKEFTDEHRAALDWLNEITNIRFRFFGLEIELWKIGDSLPAPKFNVVCNPNDWSRSIKKNNRDFSESVLQPAKIVQLKFWTGLKDYIEENSAVIRPQAPRPQHWANFGIGKAGTKLVALINTRDKSIAVGFETFGTDDKSLFESLFNQKGEIEDEMGFELNWDSGEGRKFTRISHHRHADLDSDQEWESHFIWVLEHLEKFNDAFRNRIKG